MKKQIEEEIKQYTTRSIPISEGNDFSQLKLTQRITQFENKIYPTGKFTKAGDYKYWFEIINPRIDSEVKNVDFDTKDISVEPSPPYKKTDELPCLVTNLRLGEYLRDTGQSEEINSGIEEGAGWGNIVWKKIKGGYERVDLKNFYVINQTARDLTNSPVIERHPLSQSDLREKISVWKNVEKVIDECGEDSYKSTQETTSFETTVPYYEIFERNGEVSLKSLKEEKGEKVMKGDENKYVLAKVIVAAVKGQNSPEIKYILYADEISKMPYKEYHRGRYKGRWWREGIYELLFDLQVRANQIGNELAQGLSWSAKVFFTSKDKLIIQNILTDLNNGDIIQAEDIRQIEVRMQGFDQLANEWNRVIEQANDLANSREVVQGITPPSGTPLGTTRMLDINANKLFDFIREKLAIPFREIFEEWIIPELIKEIKTQDIIRLTGDTDTLGRLYELAVNSWYLKNLISIGPHTKEFADDIKDQKMTELSKRPQFLLKLLKDAFKGFKPKAKVVITGENSTRTERLQNLASFISLETDPVRRSYLIERAMRMSGMDVGDMPKSEPAPVAPVRPEPAKTEISV